MTITDRLRMELWLRENITKYGDEFYTELARVLTRIQNEELDPRGKPYLAELQHK